MDDRDSISKGIRFENMDALLKSFSGFEKLSGTAEAERAVGYIMDELSRHGVPCERCVADAYLSDPLTSSLVVDGYGDIPSRPRSFSGNHPEVLAAELAYDSLSERSGVCGSERRRAFREYKGKIVVCHGYDEGYARALADAGAVGIVQIWPSDEAVLHEDTVGTVWGTPTFDTARFLIDIPVVSILRRDGGLLAERLRSGRCTAKLRSEVSTGVREISFPVASIPGRTEDFVLLSGHYDTWYDGIIDNGTSNAACLEIARVLWENRADLVRGVKVAWWAGHSNGRYMGSTWYCDTHWDELYEHCLAHVNADCIGSKDTDSVFVKTTGLEGREFTAAIAERLTGSPPAEFGRLGRGADQSFWGPGIPYHITARHEVGRRRRSSACPGAGVWWWHCPEDTYDKVDPAILMEDARLLCEIVHELAVRRTLPLDLDGYFAGIRSVLDEAESSSDPVFGFSDFRFWLSTVEAKARRALSRCGSDEAARNRLIKLVGGELNRLTHSYSGRYEPDLALSRGPLPYVSVVSGVRRETTPEDEFLFLRTEFLRQRNRFVTDMKKLLREMDLEAAMSGDA